MVRRDHTHPKVSDEQKNYLHDGRDQLVDLGEGGVLYVQTIRGDSEINPIINKTIQ
jgi:hypothetical protein